MRHAPSSLGKKLLPFFPENEIHQKGCRMWPRGELGHPNPGGELGEYWIHEYIIRWRSGLHGSIGEMIVLSQDDLELAGRKKLI